MENIATKDTCKPFTKAKKYMFIFGAEWTTVWVVAACSLGDRCQHFRGTCRLSVPCNTDPYLPDSMVPQPRRLDVTLNCHENLTSYFILGLRSANTLLQRSCSARSNTKFLMWLSFSSFLLSKTTTNIMWGSVEAITYVLWSCNKWYNVTFIYHIF